MLKRFLLVGLVLWGGVSLAQEGDSPIDLNILATDDSNYPQITLHLSAHDTLQLLPVNGLTTESLTITSDQGAALTVESVERAERPKRVILVADVTGSVNDEELAAQVEAGQILAVGLGADDSLGLAVMGADLAQVVVPVGLDRDAVLTALAGLEPQADAQGNTFWDALGVAIESFGQSPIGTRQIIILMTDLGAGAGSGSRDANAVIAAAVAARAEIYTLYFIPDEDDTPAEGESVPPELSLLSDGTGGLALYQGGHLITRGDFNDEANLPDLMLILLNLLNQEMRLTLRSPLPADGTAQGFTVSALGAEVRGRFNAGQLPPTPTPTQSPIPLTPEPDPIPMAANASEESTAWLMWVIGGGCFALVCIIGGGLIGLWIVRRLPQRIPTPLDRAIVANLHGDDGMVWPLYQGVNTLGRHDSNTIQIHDEAVSRRHAQITVETSRALYQDWKSSHPTEINGQLLERGASHELQHGDTLRIGSTLITFKRSG